MTRIGLRVVLGALALACATTSRTIQGRGFSYQYRTDVKEVYPGHFTGEYLNQGICLNNIGQKDEEAGILTETGAFDGVWKSSEEPTTCTFKSQTTCVFDDASSYIAEQAGTCKQGATGFLIFEARGTFVSGTGRFEGITGTVSLTSWTISPPPERMGWSKVSGIYTLPKK